MSDFRAVIEREMKRVQVPPPSLSLSDFQGRMAHRVRVRRVAVTGFGLLMGLLVVASAFLVLEARRHAGQPANGSITTSNVSGLGLVWTGWSGAAGEGGQLVVSGGRLYAVVNGQLAAFSTTCASSGPNCSPVWSASLPWAADQHWWGSPTVVDGRVYAGAVGQVQAFPTSCVGTCSPVWRARTIGSSTASSPVVVDGVVYVSADGGRGHRSRLYAFPETCQTRYCAPLWFADVPAGLLASPAVSGGSVYVGSTDGTLEAFPITCPLASVPCKPQWRTLLSPGGHSLGVGEIFAAPVVSDGELYVASGARVYAFETACTRTGNTCRPDWIGITDGPVGPVLSVGGYVYAWSGSPGHPATLSVFPASCGASGASCEPVWHLTQAGTADGGAQPYVAHGVLYLGSSPTKIEAFPADCGLNGGTCRSLWSGSMHDPGGGEVVADGALYALDVSGRVYAFGQGGHATLGSTGIVTSAASPSRPSPWTYAFYAGLIGVAGSIGLRARRRRVLNRRTPDAPMRREP